MMTHTIIITTRMMPRIIKTTIIFMMTIRQHEAADGSLRTLTERRGRVVRTGPGSWLLLKVKISSLKNYQGFSDDANEFILCEI